MSRNGNSIFWLAVLPMLVVSLEIPQIFVAFFLRDSISSSETKFFILNGGRKEVKGTPHPWYSKSRKWGNPTFTGILIVNNFWDNPSVLQSLLPDFLNIFSCFLLTYRIQTVLVRGKSQGLLSKTIFPIGAKRLSVSLWKYKETERYVNILH